MKRYYHLEGVEYAVSLCTAKARPGSDLEREKALHIRRTVGNDTSECIMYDAEMPVDEVTMAGLIKFPGETCTDPDILATVTENQEDVEEQLAPDFLIAELNRICEQNRNERDQAIAAMDAAKEAHRQDVRLYAEEKARDRFMNGLFLTVIMIAIVILLANFKAMAIWLAVLVCLALFVRMIYSTKVYFGRRKEKKREK